MKCFLRTRMRKDIARSYPYIGHCKSNGNIVLFTAARTGVMLNRVGDRQPGYSSIAWEEDAFEITDHEVVLTND